MAGNFALISLNVGILAGFYTMLGGFLSYLIYYLFEDHTENWEKNHSLMYQLIDVFIEISIVGLVAFWVTYGFKEAAPLVPMSKELDSLVDTYISAVFFGYSMFIFLDQLTSKIKYVFNTLFKNYFDRVLYPDGSILDIPAKLLSRKTDTK